MASIEPDVQQDVPQGGGARKRHHPVKLTLEEIKVIKECRRNSIMYRGIPLGIICGGVARVVTQAGYFRKHTGLFYVGMVSFGVLTGVGSYSIKCMEKMLALENSRIGDDCRRLLQDAGVDVPFEKPVDDDPFESPLNRRLQESNKWDEIQSQSRQSRQAQSPTSNEKGISYHELRLRNQANVGDYKSLTPEEEDDLDRQNRHLSPESSTSSESRLPSMSDDPYVNKESEEKHKKTYARGIPRKNQYGDEIV